MLKIHGGPVYQFSNEFDFEWQLVAAEGFAVVAANPRGSSGRGEKFSTAIWADWGNKDGQDVLAAVDYAVAAGVADPARLGVGGWSYGGILTNQVIARDRRFKAAISGAGQSNALAGYGTDQYVREYEAELGLPWANPEAYTRVSFPFFHADRIVTPTLFLCGERDFNVPLLNSEQMYQALRSLGRETELVIYPGEYHPGEYHELRKPGHRRTGPSATRPGMAVILSEELKPRRTERRGGFPARHSPSPLLCHPAVLYAGLRRLLIEKPSPCAFRGLGRSREPQLERYHGLSAGRRTSSAAGHGHVAPNHRSGFSIPAAKRRERRPPQGPAGGRRVVHYRDHPGPPGPDDHVDLGECSRPLQPERLLTGAKR